MLDIDSTRSVALNDEVPSAAAPRAGHDPLPIRFLYDPALRRFQYDPPPIWRGLPTLAEDQRSISDLREVDAWRRRRSAELKLPQPGFVFIVS